ncbi:alpha/beta hydrolase [Winogradskyella sp. A2]|uniref:alpha/beta hydrolase n=1 Tax=Winogradskyella sp. A2 TaxID=3366944 RepID=UPI00398C619F
MNLTEKETYYNTSNSYSTLNVLNKNTKNVWFVCHGMGYLSRYFLKYFKSLDPDKNYVIAPQAPSKYYQQPKMHVGANWLTRDNTQSGMENIINYFDSIFNNEQFSSNLNFIVLGYSQGVSVALRYMIKREIQCNKLIIHSGGVPVELVNKDFSYLKKETEVYLVYGTKDEYLNEQRIAEETKKAKELFGDKLQIIPFDGSHTVNVSFINSIV